MLPNVFLVNRSVTWWRSLHQGTTILDTLQPKIHDQMAFTLVLRHVRGRCCCAPGCSIHRWRLAWLEQQVEAAELDEAIAERRAEGAPSSRAAGGAVDPVDGTPAIGQSEPAMSNWGYVWLGLGHHRRRRSWPTPRGCSSAGAPLSRRVAARGPSMDVIEPPAAVLRPRRPGADGPTSPPPAADARAARRWLPTVVIVLVLVGAGFVVSKALTSATLFFYNADEAVAKQSRARHQPVPHPGHGRERHRARTADGADFTITYNGVEVPVDHVGDPPELFKPGEPVVLEGHWDPTASGCSTATSCW